MEHTVTYRVVNQACGNSYTDVVFSIQLDDGVCEATLFQAESGMITCAIDGVLRHYTVLYVESQSKFYVHSAAIGTWVIVKKSRFPNRQHIAEDLPGYTAPMPGKVQYY